MKLRFHLIILVVTAFLPLLLFAGVMIVRFDRQQRAAVESHMIDTARALSLAVDREVAAWIGILKALGSSKYLDTENLSAFREEAARVLKTRDDWNNILLTDSEGHQLLNLLLPLGSPLPHVRDLEQFRRIIKTSRPLVSNLFLGRVSRKHVIGAAVPVVRDGKVKFVLASSTPPNSLLQILTEQDIPPDWIGTIIDRKGIVIARSRNFQQLVGKPALVLRGAPSGEVEQGLGHITDDGTELLVAFRRSKLTGWTVRLAIPVSILEAPLHRSLLHTVAGGLLLLVGAVALATLFGRRIAKPIVRLSASAEALGRGETPQTTTSPVIEVNMVARVIEDAAAKRKQTEGQLKRSLEHMGVLQEINRAISSTLDLPTVLKLLLEKVELLLPYSATSVMLTNRETGALEPVACRNPDETDWKKYWGRAKGLAKIVFETRSSLAIKNLQADPRVANPDFVRKHGLVSFLGLPLVAHDTALGFIGFNTRAEHEFSTEEIDFLSMLAGQAAIAIHNSQLYERAKKLSEELLAYHQQLRALMNRLIKTREDEARRIAREIHDESGQILASAYIALDEIRRELSPETANKLNNVAQLLDQIESQLRNISHELHPTILDDLGLLPALQLLTQRFSKRTGTHIALDEVPKQRFPLRIETALYRTVQEALNNVTKHAQATAVRVQIQQEDGIVRCLVIDNGTGFDVPAVLSRTGAESLGLIGIRERVEILKGKLQIQSAPGQGTQLCVTIPLEE